MPCPYCKQGNKFTAGKDRQKRMLAPQGEKSVPLLKEVLWESKLR
jgi:hypothetical protein